MLPFSYFTGSYRLLDFKNFPAEIGTGILIDFFCNAVPILFIQAINNASLSQNAFDSGEVFKFSYLQTAAIISKIALLSDLVFEFIMFCYELYKLHHLEKQAINVIVRFDEAERRKMFAKKYTCRIMGWLTLLIAAFIAI